MALATRFDQLIRDGIVADQAELARLGSVSRARVTQIMNPLNLALDIQEELLILADELHESHIAARHLRPISNLANWTLQRQLWRELKTGKQ